MPLRTIHPPREEWPNLPTPLTEGEVEVVDFFDRLLPAKWEIYIQPALNGLYPDIVLLHPQRGVGVFEVKDWVGDGEVYEVARGDRPSLIARFPNQSRRVRIVGSRNPFYRVRDYRYTLADLSGLHYRFVTAGVIFTKGDSAFWRKAGRAFLREDESKAAGYFPVAGAANLQGKKLAPVFPAATGSSYRLAPEEEEKLASLRTWLRRSDYDRMQSEPLAIDAEQLKIVNSDPGSTGLRRMRGPAGSGKSLVLAARAAQLALRLVRGDPDGVDNRGVLVVGFNITLSHYLHDLTMRHLRSLTDDGVERSRAARRLLFTHYHSWARTCCQVYDGSARWSAILVDEGADFELDWWCNLRSALFPGGEMMLAFDTSQDLYRRAGAWTEDAMQGSGFRGGWRDLRGSYRCHPGLLPFLSAFVDEFMSGTDVFLPEAIQPDLDVPARLRWVQIHRKDEWISTCVGELRSLLLDLPEDSHPSDVVCLISEHNEGFQMVQRLQAELGYDVMHIFSDAKCERARQFQSRLLKLKFWAGSGLLKCSTVHSFKGWEARHLLIYVDSVSRRGKIDDASVFYVGLTRLLRRGKGCSLTVVSSCPDLRALGERFFADFEYRAG